PHRGPLRRQRRGLRARARAPRGRAKEDPDPGRRPAAGAARLTPTLPGTFREKSATEEEAPMKTPHVCCGCGGLCDSGHPCPMAYNCATCARDRGAAAAVRAKLIQVGQRWRELESDRIVVI